ncbi:MAG: HEPN domain-containing protein [Candidatus Pedobacter colombiensis]|uniref:HEPN domain-containing protein n=1 Tax=Candidatus Pedobacter colombiensis TaxID=3121371 RepID=A0AAJ6BAQ6_9SPHI|nr:HEPN domain-containing protein [Pedobacter sp.]WEK21498.1 MAG: HEPN domain-containing protein [Pedobacter sp.]
MELQILSPTEDHAIYFKAFIHKLVQKFKPLQIFSFSKNSYTHDDQGCFKEKAATFHCDYCLLLVTDSNTRIDYEAQDFSNGNYKQGVITVLCHGKEAIEEAIIANNRFFITVCSTAKLIYSHNGMTTFDLSNRFIPTEAAIKARKHFDHRITLADGFLTGAHECIITEQHNVCAFMLHQVVEQTCIALIRVHLAYRAEIHNLQRLLRLCSSFSNAPIKMFLSGSPADEKLFDLLLKSYSGARYKDTFKVSEDDSWLLYNKVSEFVTLAKGMCEDKIAQLTHQSMIYSEFVASAKAVNY